MDPEDIVGRDAVIAEMRSLLGRGVDVVISDPRRMGKTCLLDRFVYLSRSPWIAIKIDYEGVKTTDEFLRRTVEGLRAHDRLRSRVVASVKSYIENIEVGAGPLKVAATFQGRLPADLLDTTVLRMDERLNAPERLVLALDEIPLAIENIAGNEGPLSADTLLQTLRRLRQRTKHIRWIVTGSVGFHHVLRVAGTTEGAINDLVNVACGPLDVLWARELARMLLRGIEADFDEATVIALVETSGGIPIFLHHLANLLRGVHGCCTPQSVQVAWETFVNDRDQSRAATHLLTRLDTYYGEGANPAKRVLDMVAKSAEPIPAETILDSIASVPEVIDNLVDDHYLIDTPQGLEWRYPVLRRIWVVRRRLS